MPARAAGSDAAYPDFVEQVFLSKEAALKSAFPACSAVGETIHVLSKEKKTRIEGRLGWTLDASSITVYGCSNAIESQGQAVIAEEIGKFKPITFMVKVGAGGEVEKVEVMTYREPVGAEVKRTRFTRQFRGKSASSPLRINRDILNVTGATMSVQAMTAGVKKSLIILDEINHGK
ncbi:MAG: hypothetical protein A2901_00265 [Elusimicrobia bacterium RIFCSPLOWO2_01_FULL_54_10]|nr:MAG: hypothetical protein A2901_00265 [Elusimicrobia bacterium RIFCSPLOWO2_01_FULL_54_10]